MLIEKPNPDLWWSGVSSEMRRSCHDLMKIVGDVRPDEILELGFNGLNISTVLISRRSHLDPAIMMLKTSPESWWTGLSFAQREFVQELSDILRELESDSEKLLEIRNSGESIRATLVLKGVNPMNN